VADLVNRYMLDGSDADLQRLLRLSQTLADTASRAFRRVGVCEGWRVLDCGCGPIGALPSLAECVGRSGAVVGIDASAPAVDRAKAAVAALGLDNVQVYVSDVHTAEVAALGGPFDLAYTRLFLMHQSDPVRTLSQIAGLLRPGGWIVAHEALRGPAPRSSPDLEALETYWELLHQLIEHAGVSPRSVDDLARDARAAGLEVSSSAGFFTVMEPAVAFELHASTLAAARSRAIDAGVASACEIDELIQALRTAKSSDYGWVTSPFFLDHAFRKPDGSV
jgi:SAM-dependent methyltransferase